jgi:hypothetical protein
VTPALRRFALTSHVVFSVGWLGAAAAYLALAIVGRTTQNAQIATSIYTVLKLIGWLAVVPCSLAAIVTGLVQSLGAEWGLFRHYWMVTKLALTAVATVILIVHMGTVSHVADLAVAPTFRPADLGTVRLQLIIHAAGGLVVLLTTTALSIYKPFGRIPQRRGAAVSLSPARYATLAIIGLGVLALVLHVLAGGIRGH